MPIRTLLPPGGFSNLVGHYVAALDVGLESIRETSLQAHAAGQGTAANDILGRIGNLERTWVHAAVGDVPTPPAPAADADADAWLGWLDAVRTVTVMVLRPLQDRDLERVVHVEGEGESGGRTLKRLLSELLFLQGSEHGRLAALL